MSEIPLFEGKAHVQITREGSLIRFWISTGKDLFYAVLDKDSFYFPPLGTQIYKYGYTNKAITQLVKTKGSPAEFFESIEVEA